LLLQGMLRSDKSYMKYAALKLINQISII